MAGSAVPLASASAYDAEDGPLPVYWMSDRDGAIGNGDMVSLDALSPGPHRIVARATDSDGFTTRAELLAEGRYH